MNVSESKALLLFLLLSVLLVILKVDAAELPQTFRSEIAHLSSYVETSGCVYYRNGTWYNDAKAVCEHIRTKHKYFSDRGRINSTEDFIRWAATKSEISGKPYMVRCGNGPELPLATWLTDELARYRKSGSQNRNPAGGAHEK